MSTYLHHPDDDKKDEKGTLPQATPPHDVDVLTATVGDNIIQISTSICSMWLQHLVQKVFVRYSRLQQVDQALAS